METREKGFTLVEVLTVIGILSMLLAAIIVVTRSSPEKAAAAGTKGLLLKLSLALQRYHSEFRVFPPDGYDFPVTAPNGLQLKGSACLTYYLAWKYPDGEGGFEDYEMKKPFYIDSENITMVPVNQEVPFWADCKPKDDLNKYGEVRDKFSLGNPLRYDNCERRRDKKVRYSPDIQPMAGEKDDPDPRAENNNDHPFNAGRYDLWSCGADGGTEDTSAKDDIISGQEMAK